MADLIEALEKFMSETSTVETELTLEQREAIFTYASSMCVHTGQDVETALSLASRWFWIANKGKQGFTADNSSLPLLHRFNIMSSNNRLGAAASA